MVNEVLTGSVVIVGAFLNSLWSVIPTELFLRIFFQIK